MGRFLDRISVLKKNKLLYLLILLFLLNIPLITYLFISKRSVVLSWFNPGWLFRKSIVLSEAGSNVDVLIPVDTATLIGEGKMRGDCGDIRFVDSNGSTLLQYWIEGGCNTSATQIWVRVPSSTVGKGIYMYYGNSGATSAQMGWGGKVYMYSDSVCPAGWSRASEMDNRFLYGSTTFGQVGGSDTHTHGNASCTSANVAHTPVNATSGHTVHTFKSSGTFTVNQPITAEVLVVAGGGGGGANHGGGGGAGGLIATTHTFAPGSYTVTVGEGGAGGTGSSAGANGGNSSIGSLVATGGGGGGGFNGYYWTSAGNGGSGGGASRRQYNPGHGIAGQGHDGASANHDESIHAGGGGGAGSAGFRGTSSNGGNGGIGYASSISGSLRYYAGGGGGASGINHGLGGGYGHSGGGRGSYFTVPGANAVPNTGSGGGGGGSSWDVFVNSGGRGASGIVIIKYSGSRVTNGGIVSPINVQVASTNHTHSMSVGINVGSHIPLYKSVVVCKKDSFLIPAGMISPFIEKPTNTWSQFNGFDGYFPRASASYGSTGGNNTHTHTLVPMNTSLLSSGDLLLGRGAFVGAGGTITTSGNDRIHTFTSNGNFQALASGHVDVLVVGGGGGGGNTGSGGGGGGFVSEINFFVNAGNYPVNVGLGGSGGSVPYAAGTQGGNSTFSSITAVGGGGGVTHGWSGQNGGSGGGAGLKTSAPNATGGTGVAGQGNAGGPGRVHGEWKGSNAGGGGAGSVGGSSVIDWSEAGTGGHGFPSSISGSEKHYAGGGFGGEVKQGGGSMGGVSGGGTVVQNGPGGHGVANTGGGGGGGSYNEHAPIHNDRYMNGGNGGSGIVIIRYPFSSQTNVAPSNHTHTTNASTIASAMHMPPYRMLIFGKSNSSTYVTNRNLVITSAVPPLGYIRFHPMDNLFAVGSPTYGATGGVSTHQHNISIQTGTTSSSASILGGSGLTFVGANHTHSCSTISSSASNIPSYYSVIYARRKNSMNVNIGVEVGQNKAPNIPTSLQTNSQTNPENINTLTPTFSALFSDPDPQDKSSHYRIQVNTSSDFTGTMMWDSGKVAFSNPVDNGSISPEIPYTGTPLSWGTKYYWRIQFWDNNTTYQQVSPWSETAYFSTLGVPNPPILSEPQATSTTSIRWKFTYSGGTEIGVKLLDQSDNILKTCMGNSITYCEEDGLEENTQYTRKLVAFNVVGDSTPSSTISRYTLISVPEIQYGLHKDTTSIALKTTVQPNSQVYFDCTDTSCDTGLNQWISVGDATATALENNTKYSFQVKARNGDNIETEYSTPISIYTLSPVPTVSVTSNTSNSVTLSAVGVNNLTEGLSGVFWEIDSSTAPTGVLTGVGEWLNSSQTTVIPLSPSTAYKFKAKSRNSEGIESIYSADIESVTKPSTQIINIDHSKTSTSSISMNINIPEIGQYTSESYLIYEEKNAKYLNMTTSLLENSPSWSPYMQLHGSLPLSLTANSLQPNTEYKFAVKAKNTGGVEGDYSYSSPVFTKILTPTGFTTINILSNEVTYSLDPVADSSVAYYKIYDENGNLKVTCTYQQIQNSLCKEENLKPKTEYKRSIQAYNSNTESDKTAIHTFTTRFGVLTLESIKALTSSSVELLIKGSEGDTVEIYEETEGKYYNPNNQSLSSTEYSFSFAKQVVVKNLDPNRKYSFKIRGVYSPGIYSQWSELSDVYTYAKIPNILKIEEIDGNTVKIYIDGVGNPSQTKYIIKEINSGRYLDYETHTLIEQQKYGVYSDFGTSNGILLSKLETGKQYVFTIAALNSANILTKWSPTKHIGAKAIIFNIAENIKVSLLDNMSVSPVTRKDGQYGLQTIRVFSKNYLLADIPILFSEDRDWKDAVLESSAKESKSVVKLSEKEGFSGKYIMYVLANKTESFVLCPNAEKLSDVSVGCKGAVKYTGNFPQKKNVNGNDISVSKVVLEGVEYWVVDGLTGTGGIGYTEDKITKKVEEHIPPKKEKKSIIENITKGLQIKEIVEEHKEEINTSVAVTTTTISTISAAMIFTDISQLLYFSSHIFNTLLISLGFKKRNRPYGYVYDSRTKDPISMAIVRIINNEGKLVSTSVTDSKGRFTSNIEEGHYTVTISKKGYRFPSTIVTGSIDYPIYNVYNNGFDVHENQEIEIAIPIDPIEKNIDSKIVIKDYFRKSLLILNILLLIGGILLSIYMSINYPSILNYIILSLYLLPIGTMLFVMKVNHIKYGIIRDKLGNRVEGVSVLLKEAEFGRVIQKRVTNQKGGYRFILDKGRYQLVVGNSGVSNIFTIKEDNTILARDIKI